ncbi:ccr4-associated factor, partial [Hyphodiscus hymeniophilus]
DSVAKSLTALVVLSFMSSFSNRDSTSSPVQPATLQKQYEPPRQDFGRRPATPPNQSQHPSSMDAGESPQPRVQRERAVSRPMSMVQTYQPPLMDVSQDTLPELQPIFTFLNSHSNKLYQEGYFLKLDDQNTQGRANADRTWTECFAQLVGTVLSLWDAAELDAAGQDGEVLPKFINLTDASIKMIESLPTRSDNEAPLQNVLSISTAGKNRYLLHFNSHHSLIQWTAGIRLAMFEHATLQEAYTGALIAGKGKALNNIGVIMERSKLKTEDWARVRFGAGTPWRRCWCVVTPPDEKEVQKLQKQVNKKKSAYDRSRPPVLKGDVKFYDTKKTKKMQPIATITEAYSAFAIYPQSKPLIDASTLVKVEGSITIHSNPPSTTEGFVFVMPEVHPAVTGFEIMLRWLFPVFDIFALYGRPGRLIADTTNPESLMFAMPKHRRYGYLEILDVSGLILEQGSANWRESEWRKRMKELTGKRMTAIENGSRTTSQYGSRRGTRNSFGPSRSRLQFEDGASIRSSPSITWNHGPPADVPNGIPRTDSAPPTQGAFSSPKKQPGSHHRAVSETQGLDRYADQGPPSNYDGTYETAPNPPPHNIGITAASVGTGLRYTSDRGTPERVSSEDEFARATPVRELQELAATTSPEPVAPPPAFAHAPGTLPPTKPYHSPELRRANSRMSNATLSQLAGAGGVAAGIHAGGERPRTSEDQRHQEMGRYSEDRGQRGVLSDANAKESPANHDGLNEGLVAARNSRFSFEHSSPVQRSDTDTSKIPQQTQFSPYISNSRVGDNHSVQPHGRNDAPQSRTYDPPQITSGPNSQATPPKQPYAKGHAEQHSTDSMGSTSFQEPPLHISQSIARKPLPVQTASLQTPTSAESPSRTSSLGQNVIDQAAFNLIGTPEDVKAAPADYLFPATEQGRNRGNSAVSSLYEDSSSTLDYYSNSTRPSMNTRNSADRPRAGVMRTVGSVAEESAAKESPIRIDFGPTMNLTSDRAPRAVSPGPDQSYATTHAHPVRSHSPGPLQSYTADRPARYGNPARKASPGPGMNYPGAGVRPQSADHSRSPSQSMTTPEGHFRSDSSESRTVAWQPGMSVMAGASLGKQQAITPEQFVQQRAQAMPVYAHQRQSSANALNTARNSTPTPPPVGNHRPGHSRNSSADLFQRPGSRGAATSLGPTGDIAPSLSAREQEHIARLTKQPLVNMAQNNRQSMGGGLVNTIEAREKDKQQMKAGINSQAVQHAILQRQQQAMQQQHPQQEYRISQSHYGSLGQYPQQYPVQPQRQQQQWGVHPAANVYAQGGGFTAPSPEYRNPETGRQSPTMQQYSTQQYFNPQQPGGPGQGGRGYYPGQPN